MRFPLLVILLSFLFISCEEEDNSPFYVAKNGVTIKARDWVTVGTTAELNGVTYTAVDLASLKEWIGDDKDPSKVVTTKVETWGSQIAGLFLSTGKEIKGIEGWDVSNWTSMQGIFYSAEPVNADLSGWDVSQVTDMQLFMRLGDVNININNWEVKIQCLCYNLHQFFFQNFIPNIGFDDPVCHFGNTHFFDVIKKTLGELGDGFRKI